MNKDLLAYILLLFSVFILGFIMGRANERNARKKLVEDTWRRAKEKEHNNE